MAGTSASGNRGASFRGPYCSAHRKDGGDCRAPAMANGKCAVHGGKTPGGVASVHWRHGRHSKHLGPVLGPLVAEAMADPDRHSMEQELALIDARLAQLLASIEGKDGPSAWGRLAEELDRFHAASRDPSKTAGARMSQAMSAIDHLVSEGLGETAAWSQILEVIDRRRVLVESEEKRAITSGRAIPVDQVINMLASFTRAVLDDVPEPDRRRRIADRIRAIMHGRRLPMADMPRQLLEASRA